MPGAGGMRMPFASTVALSTSTRIEPQGRAQHAQRKSFDAEQAQDFIAAFAVGAQGADFLLAFQDAGGHGIENAQHDDGDDDDLDHAELGIEPVHRMLVVNLVQDRERNGLELGMAGADKVCHGAEIVHRGEPQRDALDPVRLQQGQRRVQRNAEDGLVKFLESGVEDARHLEHGLVHAAPRAARHHRHAVPHPHAQTAGKAHAQDQCRSARRTDSCRR